MVRAASALTTSDVDNSSGFVYTLVDDAVGRFAISGSSLVVGNGAALETQFATLSTGLAVTNTNFAIV